MSSFDFPPQSEQPLDPMSRLGRYAPLYQQWACSQDHLGLMLPPLSGTSEQRRMALELWLRALVTTGQIKLHGSLPHYADLGAPFGLSADQVGRLIQRLRREGVLPARPLRSDAGKSQWNGRDEETLRWGTELWPERTWHVD